MRIIIFYFYAKAPNDWFVYDNSSAQNNELWSGGIITLTTATKKSVFDPCPVGWRIPPWLNNTSPFATMNTGWAWGNNGLNWNGTGGYFPASGVRNDSNGGFYGVSTFGFSWSGSPNKTNGYSLNFNTPSNSANPASASGRSNGIPVRCCQDNL